MEPPQCLNNVFKSVAGRLSTAAFPTVLQSASWCLLFGLPSQQIQRLQLIQNSAARLVTRTKKHDSISSVLRNLHWLPIQSRIHFKVLLFAYQCFHQFGPSYLVELLTQYKPERTL